METNKIEELKLNAKKGFIISTIFLLLEIPIIIFFVLITAAILRAIENSKTFYEALISTLVLTQIFGYIVIGLAIIELILWITVFIFAVKVMIIGNQIDKKNFILYLLCLIGCFICFVATVIFLGIFAFKKSKVEIQNQKNDANL